jgi:hypothetical protein
MRVVVTFRRIVSPVIRPAASGFTYHPDHDGDGDDGDDYQNE